MPETRYKTKQRDEILRFFMDNEDKCFSAKDVFERVKAGEATVFRTISTLTKEGKLKRFTGDSSRGECAYYQYNVCEDKPSHIHLKCDDCGKLIHMDCEFMSEIITHFELDHSFSVDCGKTVIYGRCEECRNSHVGAKRVDCHE